MKKVTLSRISLENFGKHSKFSTTLGRRTYIKGANETGKSTIKRAIQFIFGVRDENGKEITGIRPHDENGVDKDDLQTIVNIDAVVDGESTEWKKNYHQNLNKKGEFTGNSTDCYIDDIPKRTKDYDDYMLQVLPNEVCINAMTLLNLDTNKRRKMLEDAFSEHTVDSIIDEHSEFEPLRKQLQNATTAELKTKYRAILKGDKTHNGLEKDLDDKNVEIRTVKSMLSGLNIADSESKMKSLEDAIAANKAKQGDYESQVKEYQKYLDDAMKLRFKLSDMQRDANSSLMDKKRDIQGKIDDCAMEMMMIKADISKCERDIEILSSNISNAEAQKKQYADDWKAVKEEKFDESTLECPTCHRILPDDEVEKIKSNFSESKAKRLKNIEANGNELKVSIDKKKATLSDLEAKRKELLLNKEEIQSKMDALEQEYKNVPDSIDISDTADYKAVIDEISAKEKTMAQCDDAQAERMQLTSEYEELISQLERVKSDIRYYESLEAKVKTHEEERATIITKIGDATAQLELVKQFENLKATILESDVNKHFEYVQFRMFEKQINGDLKDICSPVVKGESYDRNMNHGSKILTEIDICRAFQKKYDVCLPIIVDDFESLDTWRVPDIENQLILIMRSNDEELTVVPL